MNILGFIAIILAILSFFGQFSVFKQDKMRSHLIAIEGVLWFIAAAICFK